MSNCHLSFASLSLFACLQDYIIISMRAEGMVVLWETEQRLYAKSTAKRMLSVLLAAVLLLWTLSVMSWEETEGPWIQSADQMFVCADLQKLYAGRTDMIPLRKSETAVQAMLVRKTGRQEALPVETAGREEYKEEFLTDRSGQALMQTGAYTEENMEGPNQNSSVSFGGSLGTMYCVGASPDLSSVFVTEGGKTLPLSCYQTEGWDSSGAGDGVLTVEAGGQKLSIPYSVTEYKAVLDPMGGSMSIQEVSLWDYRLPVIQEPVKPGKDFAGWYLDPACTVPFETACYGETSLTLYAGWTDFPGFICDSQGYITGTTQLEIRDGFLILPSDSGCTGIRRGAFSGLSDVTEIYIPEGITCIEPGAFGGMEQLFYIEVSPENPVYKSVNGILYLKTGEKVL